MNVHLLCHVHHTDDAGRKRHQDTLDGDWFADEQVFELVDQSQPPD